MSKMLCVTANYNSFLAFETQVGLFLKFQKLSLLVHLKNTCFFRRIPANVVGGYTRDFYFG